MINFIILMLTIWSVAGMFVFGCTDGMNIFDAPKIWKIVVYVILHGPFIWLLSIVILIAVISLNIKDWSMK